MSDTVGSKWLALFTWAEGFKSLPYLDSVGVWTIGKGYNLEAHGIPPNLVKKILSKTGITEAEANVLLYNEIISCYKKARELFPNPQEPMLEVHWFVITDMIFNMGLGDDNHGFLSFKKTIAAMNRGDWEEAAAQMKDSNWYRQTKRRARRDILMLKKGRYLSEDELAQID